MPATVGFQAISPEEEEVAPGKHSKFMAGVLGKGFTINHEMFFFLRQMDCFSAHLLSPISVRLGTNRVYLNHGVSTPFPLSEKSARPWPVDGNRAVTGHF